jgi:hypothetical protein
VSDLLNLNVSREELKDVLDTFDLFEVSVNDRLLSMQYRLEKIESLLSGLVPGEYSN